MLIPNSQMAPASRADFHPPLHPRASLTASAGVWGRRQEEKAQCEQEAQRDSWNVAERALPRWHSSSVNSSHDHWWFAPVSAHPPAATAAQRPLDSDRSTVICQFPVLAGAKAGEKEARQAGTLDLADFSDLHDAASAMFTRQRSMTCLQASNTMPDLHSSDMNSNVPARPSPACKWSSSLPSHFPFPTRGFNSPRNPPPPHPLTLDLHMVLPTGPRRSHLAPWCGSGSPTRTRNLTVILVSGVHASPTSYSLIPKP